MFSCDSFVTSAWAFLDFWPFIHSPFVHSTLIKTLLLCAELCALCTFLSQIKTWKWKKIGKENGISFQNFKKFFNNM